MSFQCGKRSTHSSSEKWLSSSLASSTDGSPTYCRPILRSLGPGAVGQAGAGWGRGRGRGTAQRAHAAPTGSRASDDAFPCCWRLGHGLLTPPPHPRAPKISCRSSAVTAPPAAAATVSLHARTLSLGSASISSSCTAPLRTTLPKPTCTCSFTCVRGGAGAAGGLEGAPPSERRRRRRRHEGAPQPQPRAPMTAGQRNRDAGQAGSRTMALEGREPNGPESCGGDGAGVDCPAWGLSGGRSALAATLGGVQQVAGARGPSPGSANAGQPAARPARPSCKPIPEASAARVHHLATVHARCAINHARGAALAGVCPPTVRSRSAKTQTGRHRRGPYRHKRPGPPSAALLPDTTVAAAAATAAAAMGGAAVDLAAGTCAGVAQLMVGHPFDTVKVGRARGAGGTGRRWASHGAYRGPAACASSPCPLLLPCPRPLPRS